MRKLVIGDIHGGFKALEQVLKRAKTTPEDTLVFLGDYIDGWSGSADVVSFLIELAKEQRCIFLRGNHDELVNQWLKTGELNETWLQHGGKSTLHAYGKLSEEKIQEHLRFYDGLLNYHIDNKNRLFVHAGFTNMHGPEREYEPYFVYWDRTLWELALSMDKDISKEDERYPERLKLFDEIFIGHTPTVRIGKTKPVHAANIWNMDTGAAFKGPLSLMDVDSKQVFQSDPVYLLYPEEEGRN